MNERVLIIIVMIIIFIIISITTIIIKLWTMADKIYGATSGFSIINLALFCLEEFPPLVSATPSGLLTLFAQLMARWPYPHNFQFVVLIHISFVSLTLFMQLRRPLPLFITSKCILDRNSRQTVSCNSVSLLLE